MTARRLALAAVAALACAPAGCGSSPAPAATILRLEVDEPAGVQHLPGLERFVERIGQRSHGKLRIAVVLAHVPDQRALVADVGRGRADLAWVDTRVFGTLGVTSFDALTAPLLVNDYATQAAVIRSGVPGQMLPDLRKLGVRGLAVVAGRLRKPIGVGRKLLAPADYRGIHLRLLDSNVYARFARALGANPINDRNSGLQDDVPDGYIGGLEDDLDSAFFDLPAGRPTYKDSGPRGPVGRPYYVTANVSFWPRTAAIVTSPRRLAELSAQQRGWLLAAAHDAVAYSTTAVDADGELARELCAAGTRFAVAGSADRHALARALAPVYAHLRSNRLSGRLIAEIQAIKRRVRPSRPFAIPAGCTTATRPVIDPARRKLNTIPNGVYRVRITPADLRAGGVRPAVPDDYGTFTLTLEHGHWKLEKHDPEPAYLEAGLYSGTPARAMFVSTYAPQLFHPSAPAAFSLVFSHAGLRIFPATENDPLFVTWYGAHTWSKIG
jgi:TRAP-type C4-dicarboxylate transport system substrate-binding protein